MNDNPNKAPPTLGMSPADFAAWGMPALAFVKRAEDGENWSIHAADGTQMGIAPDRELAFAAIRQHDLEPMSVH